MYVVKYTFVGERGIGASYRGSSQRSCKLGISEGSQLCLVYNHTPGTDRTTNASIYQSSRTSRTESSLSSLTTGTSPLHGFGMFPGHTACPF